ncbi:ABC transporter permease [Granulosicoccus antarcticus]|uniref:Ribose import permease protein RbsC n=1 Tax=Granulosicoccus antarcticus IMCC3135 TaxID=1192854 RepID=A0A2Z2P0Y2_9GAMM|nr:ABC transporter permease [Granulosicoccus antarcticus]ASJ75818.1 Ribose import permease protein RbsC [Granulosicoccus antarcticus IMCC3135]
MTPAFKLTSFLRNHHLQLLPIIVLLVLAMTVLSDSFMNTQNMINLANRISINLIIAAGMTLLITSGGIDLSVGSTVGLSAIAAALYFQNGYDAIAGPYGAIALGLGVGAMVGLLNGFLVAILGIPAFIATLGLMLAVRGVVFIISSGRTIMGFGQSYIDTFSGFTLGIPRAAIVAVITALLASFVLNRTTTGRLLQGLGGNERCLYTAGIRVKRLKMGAYVMMGILAGLAGLTLSASMSAAEPFAGTWYELDAIAVVVMGGTALAGGKGTLMGTTLGATLLGLVANSINLLGISAYYQTFLVGVMIMTAIVIGSPVLTGARAR